MINQKKGRPSKKPDMKKDVANITKKLEETEYEELFRLRAENEYIKTEIEVLKKEIRLRCFLQLLPVILITTTTNASRLKQTGCHPLSIGWHP